MEHLCGRLTLGSVDAFRLWTVRRKGHRHMCRPPSTQMVWPVM